MKIKILVFVSLLIGFLGPIKSELTAHSKTKDHSEAAFQGVNSQRANNEARPNLSEGQKVAIKQKLDELKKRAEPQALQLAQTAKRVYENMLADKPDEKLRRKLSQRMKELAGNLVLLKGQSMREAISVLTPEQKQYLRTQMNKPDAPADLTELIEKMAKPVNK